VAGWIDRLVARSQRKSDERAARWQDRQRERVRSGLITPADESYLAVLCKVIRLLTAEPVSGPDGIPVFICLSERSGRWSPPPKLPMPERWLQAIALERTLTGQAARIQMTLCYPEFVRAYAMSGPPHRMRRSFRYSGGTGAALTYVLALAEGVRSRGVKALNEPDPAAVTENSPPSGLPGIHDLQHGLVSLLDHLQLPKHCGSVAHQVKPVCKASSGTP
jgi:hypothetical protein